MKASMHNGRIGKSKHNDREFTRSKNYHDDGHIDHSKTELNCNWQLYQGMSFHENELKYYQEHFTEALQEVNQGYIRNRHSERCKTMEEWLDSTRTGPEESIMQIGNMDSHASDSELTQCMLEYNKWFFRKTKGYCQILDMSLHLDEATPHFQVRRVWQYRSKGVLKIGQEEALKRLGYELPNPNEKKSRYNNRKMVFDAEAREKWYDICEAHGFKIDRVPEKGKKHIQKQDYIILNQEHKIEMLTTRSKELEEEVVHAEHQLEQLQNEATLQKRSVRLLQADKNALEHDVAELTDKREKLESKADAVQTVVNYLIDKRFEIDEDYKVAKRTYEEYTQTHDIKTLEAEYQAKLDSLENDKKALEGKYELLQGNYDKLVAERDRLVDEIKPLRTEKERLIKGWYGEDGKHYMGIFAMREERNRLANAIKSLESQLKEKIEGIIHNFTKSVRIAIPMAVSEPERAEETLHRGQTEAHEAAAELPKPAEHEVNQVVDQTVDKAEQIIRHRRKSR